MFIEITDASTNHKRLINTDTICEVDANYIYTSRGYIECAEDYNQLKQLIASA